MGIYNVHGGHSLKCRGASGLLDEVNEDRKVKNKVISLLRAEGHTVYDCTDDNSTNQDDNLRSIVKKCNKHKVDLDVSIHLNSGRDDPKSDNNTGGVEVLNYDSGTKEVSDRICKRISAELGVHNRGTKYDKGLYVLRNTSSKALLVECCFVDDKDDAKVWNADKCAKAIVEGILNKSISSSSNKTSTSGSTPTKKPSTNTSNNSKEFKVKVNIKNLCVRKGPGTNYSKTGKYTGIGTFTIVDVKTGKGSTAGWGKLKSGAGWMSLDYAKRI